MLVFKRLDGQQVMIGSAVITVLSIHGNSVRIGIEAPAEVSIRRMEVPDSARISGNNESRPPGLESLAIPAPSPQPLETAAGHVGSVDS